MIYEIFLLHFKLRCGEGGGGFGIDSLLPFACLLSSPPPKKKSQKRDGWRVGLGLTSSSLHGASRAVFPIFT